MTNLYEIYKTITAPEHVWKFEKTDTYVKRATLHLTGIEITYEQAQTILDVLESHRAESDKLRSKGADMMQAVNKLYLELPLKEVAL